MYRIISIFLMIMVWASQVWGQNSPLQSTGLSSDFPNSFRSQGPQIGLDFPLTDYLTLDWELIPVETLKSKVVVINIWYVGCKECREEEPFLAKLTENFSENEEILFLSFSMSHENKTRKYLEKFGDFGFETMLMKRTEVENGFQVKTSPTHFIVKNGVLMEKFTLPIANEPILAWYKNRIIELSQL